jgi:hypothetical protein
MYWRDMPPKSIVPFVSPAGRAEVAGHLGTLGWPPSPDVIPDAASPVPPPLPLVVPPLVVPPLVVPPLPDAPMPELPPASSPPPPEDPGPANPPEAFMSPDAVPTPESGAGLNCVAHPTPQDSQTETNPLFVGNTMLRTVVPREGPASENGIKCSHSRFATFASGQNMCICVQIPRAARMRPYAARAGPEVSARGLPTHAEMRPPRITRRYVAGVSPVQR